MLIHIIIAQIDIATPTIMPAPNATAEFYDMLNPADATRQIAMEGVQWWNILNRGDIIAYAQLAMIIMIIFVGIGLIISALNDDGGSDV